MKIRHIDTRPTEVGQAHEALGLPPVEQVIDRAQAHPLATVASWFMGFTLFGLAAILLARYNLITQKREGRIAAQLRHSIGENVRWLAPILPSARADVLRCLQCYPRQNTSHANSS